ncbi:hypothetical protein RND81_10G106900 [Saponaria officinalis]|uniref:Uncharacterized protein n=1 Tax=Saponaria officinalis TaxID=3572 RepID=A0AAW1I0F3_SAPOF
MAHTDMRFMDASLPHEDVYTPDDVTSGQPIAPVTSTQPPVEPSTNVINTVTGPSEGIETDPVTPRIGDPSRSPGNEKVIRNSSGQPMFGSISYSTSRAIKTPTFQTPTSAGAITIFGPSYSPVSALPSIKGKLKELDLSRWAIPPSSKENHANVLALLERLETNPFDLFALKGCDHIIQELVVQEPGEFISQASQILGELHSYERTALRHLSSTTKFRQELAQASRRAEKLSNQTDMLKTQSQPVYAEVSELNAKIAELEAQLLSLKAERDGKMQVLTELYPESTYLSSCEELNTIQEAASLSLAAYEKEEQSFRAAEDGARDQVARLRSLFVPKGV